MPNNGGAFGRVNYTAQFFEVLGEAQSGINFKSRRVTSYEELKTFATGLTTQSVAYAHWYGNAESGIISGNGATYIVQNWNNGAIVIVASRHNSRDLQTITFDGINWTINNFFGTSSLDALASALGGTIKAVYNNSNPLSDFNDLTVTGRYRIDNDSVIENALNKPDLGTKKVQAGAYVDVVNLGGNLIIQRLYGLIAKDGASGYDECVFVRKLGTPITSWVRVDNFGCNTAADLASLLGGINNLRVVSSVSDFNLDLGDYGFCMFSFVSSCAHHPTGDGRGVCYHMQRSAISLNGCSALQIASLENGKRYIRSYSNSTWGNWSRIYDESIITDSTLLSPLASALGVGWNFKNINNRDGAVQLFEISGNYGVYQFSYWDYYGIVRLAGVTVDVCLRANESFDSYCELTIVNGYVCAKCTATNNNFTLYWNKLTR